jgi:transposase
VPINTHRLRGGRPRMPDRICADSIFYVLRTGCHWQALAQTDLCAPSTAHDRFQEWMHAGVFLLLWQAGPEQCEELQGIDWSWYANTRARPKLPWGEEKPAKVLPVVGRVGENALGSGLGDQSGWRLKKRTATCNQPERAS